MQTGNTTLKQKSFNATVAALVIPMALQNLINVATQSADVVMLGRLGEQAESALSASSLAGQIQFVMTLIFFGLASGASVLTAQYWGKGDVRTIEKVIGISLRISMSVALLFFLAATFVPETLMRIFIDDAEVVALGVTYLRWVAVSYLFMGFTNIYLTILRSVEKVVISTVVYFVSFATNVVLNAILIFGLLGFPQLGVAGAAIATAIARLVECIITATYAFRNPVLKLRFKDFVRWPRELMRDFMKYSTPTTLNELFWGLAIATNSVIIGRLGSQAVAANSVAQVVRQLAMVVCFGLANATAIMVGKAIGSGQKDLAQNYAGRFMRLTMLTGGIGAVVILVVRPFVLAGMGHLSPAARGYLSFLLLLMAVYVLGQAFNTTMIVGVFRGGGDTRFGMFLDLCVMWGGSLLFGALAAFVFKAPVTVVYTILMCDEFLKIPVVALRYRSKRWLRDVTR